MAQNYPKRIEIQEGIDLLLSHTERMGKEKVEIDQAYGRILACRIRPKKIFRPLTAPPMTVMPSALRMLQMRDMISR